MAGVVGMVAFGLFRGVVLGEDMPAESAGFELHAEGDQLMGLAMVFLVLRAFSSGCAALTGVEAISNGVPAFRKPKSRNAATTLLLLGTTAITMLLSIIVLAHSMGIKYVDPAQLNRLRLPNGEPVPPGYDEHTVI